MVITDAPTITIGGYKIAGAWTLRERIALDGLKLTWGRLSHIEPAYPTQLALEVIDTDGQLARSAALVGLPVSVTRGDGRVIFRGTLDDFRVRPVTVRDPLSAFNRRRVWKLTLSSGCKLAELATTIPRGTGKRAPLVSQFGPDYWENSTPDIRLAEVRDAVKSVTGIDWTNPYPPTPRLVGVLRYRSLEDKMTALDLIEGCYNAHPLGYANYSPATDRISIGRPAQTEGLELRWTNNKLRVIVPDGGLTVPASTVGVNRDADARTSVREQIDVVQVAGARYKITGTGDDAQLGYQDVITERVTAHASLRTAARREYRTSNDISYSVFVDSENVPGAGVSFSWPFPLTTVTSEYGERDGKLHAGIDMGMSPATAGAAIVAAGTGRVIVSEFHTQGGWGNYIIIDHGTTREGKQLKTLYAHMQAVGVPVGTNVLRGQTIGYVGNTGNSFGAHLHLETWENGTAIDPRVFIARYETIHNGEDIDLPEGEWQAGLAKDVAAMFDQLNGLVILPPVRFDWSRFAYAGSISDALIDTHTKRLPIYFPGSMFAPILDSAAEHEIIGGTLTYADGWALEATLAPAIRTRSNVTIAQLVTIDPPTLADFADDMILADLGNVTKGVTA